MKKTRLYLPHSGKVWGVLLWLLALLLVTVGCSGNNPANDAGNTNRIGTASSSAVKSAGAASATKDQNACHLLDQNEVSALVEEKIVMRDQTEAGDTWSTCQWENEKGVPLLMLTVYWEGGKQEWETWRVAQGAGSQVVKQAEGIGANDTVKQGQVAGLGDGAYFSGLLPSLVLKGDVLFEMNLFFVPRAETKFAGLARKLIEKIR